MYRRFGSGLTVGGSRPAEALSQFDTHSDLGTSFPLQGFTQERVDTRRSSADAQEAAQAAGRAQPRGSRALSRLRKAQKTSGDSNHLLRGRSEDLRSRPLTANRHR